MTAPETISRRDLSRGRRRQRHRLSVIGVIGEILITAGFLVFLFLGWQLWLNDIIVGDQQNHVAAELAATWDAGNSTLNHGEVLPDFGEPAVTTTPEPDSTFAVMYAPRFGSDWAREVGEGIGLDAVLNTRRIGHYPTTQLPGQIGNVALAAHRLTYGAPFRDIDQLRLGDKLYLQTKDGYYTYSFRNLEYVSPRGVGVLEPVPQRPGVEATESILTIMSCNPKFSLAERIIAYAVFESWQPISAGPPEEVATIVNAKG
ncbi:MAG: class E sortase [Microbacteriaceae bacterium]|nr:class E sortase [Microbacteriaceae bacterium]